MLDGYSMSVHAIRGFQHLAAAHGLDIEETLAAAGCPHALDDIDGRVPWQVVERIAAVTVERMGVMGILRAVASFSGEREGPLYYVAKHSPTVGVALSRIAKYYRVTNGLADCRLVETSRSTRLELIQREFLSSSFQEIMSASWALNVVSVVRHLAGLDVQPVSVWLTVPRSIDPADLEVYETTLPYPLRFGQPRSAVEFEPPTLERKVIGANPVLEAAMMRYIADLAAPIPDDATLARRLAQILVESIHRGDYSLGEAARQLGTTPRTMQRRLREEGTSYTRVLDDVRHELAIGQMRERRPSADEIASLLGFDKSSSFHRAFKRWTGVTPGEFRKRAESTWNLAGQIRRQG